MQAIAFASAPFVELSDIQKAGFSSRRACRKAFYNKTRLLYDFDVETDKLTIVQAVLLLAYWSEKPGDNKGAYYWTGIAIALVQTLGLHRKGEYNNQLQETKLLKRVWWSCYVRDRMLGLAMGRPLRIQDTELDTPPLTLQDFDIISTSDESNAMIPSTNDQIALAEIFISMVEVWNMGGRVLSLHFSVLQAECNTSTAKGDDGSSATMLFLKSTPSDPALVQLYDDQLQTFYSTLPTSCSHSFSLDQNITSSSVSTNAGYLHIVFWSVVSALHRPQLRSWDKALSLKRVEEAAIEVARVDRKLYELGRDRYLPATAAIPFQITAFIIHTKRLQYKKTDDVAEVLESLFFCVKVIEKGREAFPGGDDSVDFLQFIAFTANVTLLFDSQSRLWGVEYGGVHVCPGSRQVSQDSNLSQRGLGDALPEAVSSDAIFASHLQTPDTAGATESIDPKAFSFDDVDAVNWDSLADFLPGCSVDYDFSSPTANVNFT
ncbi:hypothetical protein LTR84_003698 [Exophiala bonariae]|uniref:Xylanolytic transcriptional activator regulatory domain-containing protein n=1 Tax=Exophiala bonariae TaxID=1690606 RepID=A0AAV9N712_9EURO|nr:hypothetical protein LTR84_003698 [Exophiala bonariae]